MSHSSGLPTTWRSLAANFCAPAVLAAFDAGQAIMEVYDSDFQVELKADQSPLTAADRASHNIIMQRLQQLWDCPVLSEESSEVPWETRRQWETFWLVDPLDGTKDFVRRSGSGEFTVNIALIHRCEPVLGIVYRPSRPTFYLGARGLGARKLVLGKDFNDRDDLSDALALSASQPALPLTRQAQPGLVRVVATRSHSNQETDDFISALEEQYGAVERVSIGSSLKFCLVAEGAADIYPRLGPTMEWDTAAAQAVAEAAGCTVKELQTGQPLRYNKPNLVNPFFVTYAADWPPNRNRA